MEASVASDDTTHSGIFFVTPSGENTFFGYFDKSPLSKPADRLLGVGTPFAKRMPASDDCAEVGFWDVNSGEYSRIGTTAAFNFQQGCMLQWLGPDFDRYVIYNEWESGHLSARVVDVENNQSSTIGVPIYAVDPTGQWALTLDFERLQHFHPGYSYEMAVRDSKRASMLHDDGIWLVDLASGRIKLIVAVEDLVNCNGGEDSAAGWHILEHIQFNPSGGRFLFYHRFGLSDGGIYTRLYTSDLAGRDVRCVVDSGKITHAAWRSEDELTYWGSCRGTLQRARAGGAGLRMLMRAVVRLYHLTVPNSAVVRSQLTGTRYWQVKDRDLAAPRATSSAMPRFDGHPSWEPTAGRLVAVDTYPDQRGEQHLFVVDVAQNQRLWLARMSSPQCIRGTGYRCDLHPRWDHSGSRLTVDSQHSGERRVYVLNVPQGEHLSAAMGNDEPIFDNP